MNLKNKADSIPTALTTLLFTPFSFFLGSIYKSKQTQFKHFFGLNVDATKSIEQIELLNELGCNDILVRIPLKDIKNIQQYKDFIELCKDKNITINIIQNREHIENEELLKKDIRLIFSTFKGICNQYQIANATNENKWGFFSIKEYLSFYKTIQTIRDEKFPQYSLIGSNIKGFEIKHTVRSLFNYFKVKYDKVGALLYMNDAKFPEATKFGIFDLKKQIDTIHALSTLAVKSNNELIIPEASWQIKEQKGVNSSAVSEDDYTLFMIRYYLFALGTKKIQSVFWFELLSSTCGLTYIHKGELHKRKAFYVLQNMIKMLNNCEVQKYTNSGGLHVLTVKDTKNKMLDIVWVEAEGSVELTEFKKVYDIYGKEMKKDIKITKSPIYAYH